MTQKYCSNCDKRVETEKDYSVGWLIVGILFCWPAAIIYYVAADEVCPVCGGQAWGSKTQKSQQSQQKSQKQSDVNFCPNCGASVSEGEKFCTDCGFELGEEKTQEGGDETDQVSDERVEESVMDYLRSHGGEIDLEKATEELDYSEGEIEAALNRLQEKGRIELE